MTTALRVKLGLALAVAVVLGAAAGTWVLRSYREVRFFNGLDEAVTVRLGGATVTVAAGGQATATVRLGGSDAEVLGADGRRLDRHPVLLRSEGEVLYNVLGAAPLYSDQVVYSSGPRGPNGPGPDLQPLAGERLVTTTADDVLREPPKSIESKGGRSGYTIRRHVGLAEGGWRTSLGMLGDAKGGPRRAVALARRLVAVLPDEAALHAWIVRTVGAVDGVEAGAAAALEALARAPDVEWVHYGLARNLRRAGKLAELRALYRAMLEKDPASPLAAGGLGRTLPPAEGEPILRAALAAHPGHQLVLGAVGRLALGQGRHAEAAETFGRLPRQVLVESGFAQPTVLALLGAGRTADALQLALEAATVKSASADDVLRYVRLAGRPDVTPPRAPAEVVKAWVGTSQGRSAWIATLLGQQAPDAALQVLSPSERTALQIMRRALTDPAAAVKLCDGADAGILLQLEEEVRLLLAAEAWRLGEQATARALYDSTDLIISEAALHAWIDRGEVPEEAWRLDPGEWAAVLLVRSRHLRASGQPWRELDRAAMARDPLRGFTMRAGAGWPPPVAPPADLVRLVLQR